MFTHGHWDHVMGHTALPDAPVWVSAHLATAVATNDPRAARYLEDAREFDSRWYVPRPAGHRWPQALRGLDEGTQSWAGGDLEVLHLPGHSPDGLGLVVDGALLPGDYLSPCEIPFVDDVAAYQQTLRRLIELLADLHEVIPGHGPRLTAPEAIAIARADLDYLDRLASSPDRASAESMAWPRAVDVVGMRDHHLENVAKRFS